MSKENRFYTYLYLNPLKNNEEFYVGYGSSERLNEHLKEVKKLIRENKSNKWINVNCSNPHKLFTIKKILELGLEPIIFKTIENVSKKEAIDEEIRLITHHGRADLGLGSLTNKTNGGDGGDTLSNHPRKKEIFERVVLKTTGLKRTDETKELMKITNKRNGIHMGEKHPMYGKSHSRKTRKKISESLKGQPSNNKGKIWYNSGTQEKRFFNGDQPDGWVRGMFSNTKNQKPWTDERRKIKKQDSIGVKNPHAKTFNFTNMETDDVISVCGWFEKFCKENNLSVFIMKHILAGKRKNKFHKGWTVAYAKKEK